MTTKQSIAIILTSLSVGASAGLISACGNDAKVSTRDRSSAVKVNMPDQFNTLAIKCVDKGVLALEGSDGNVAMAVDSGCTGLGQGTPTTP